MRLDQAIAARYPEISRRKARDLLSAHRVLVNDRVVSVASREVRDTDRIIVVAVEQEIEILRMTPDWVAVNKPSGLATQPERDRKRRSLEELLRVMLKQKGERDDLWVVHRIDVPTSGVVVFARSRQAAAKLSKLFAEREVTKTYVAVVDGDLKSPVTIETPIEAKDARTLVKPLRNLGTQTLIEATIDTGRMHQIRIHLAGIGHPVSGDRRYGSTTEAPRPMLHSYRLEAADLGALEAKWPDDFPKQ
jgi:23S rRNA pseudouridine1911/1915/1917 synthase